MTKKQYLIFGAGAIGATVAAWLTEHSRDVSVSIFDKPEVCSVIEKNGITTYCGDDPNNRATVKVSAYSDLKHVPKPDVIILCVKNYSLAGVSQFLVDQFGSDVLVVGLQNGIENQSILPEYFNKVVYGVVCFNAWVDSPGVCGYQKRGPIALGHNGGVSDAEIESLAQDFNLGVPTEIYPRLADAAHSKIIINLTNSLTTLVALHEHDQSKSKAFQKLLTAMTYEGVKVMKAAGYRESKLGGMPSWGLITAAGILPAFITRKAYLKNLKKMVVSSMAQDIIVNGGTTSELDSINGYVLGLAKKHGVNTPINNAIYKLCQEEFIKQPFKPMRVEKIWERINQSA